MGLVDLVKKRVEPRHKLSMEEIRKAKPVRNPAVTCTRGDDGTALLEAPLELQGKGMTAWLARKMQVPATKKFELEPVGAFLWDLFDGEHTVEAISRKLKDQYKMNRVEAEASLNAFLQMLVQRKLITVTIPQRGKKG